MSITKLLKSLENLSEVGYVGEPVSQLEHGLQAAGLAIKAGAGEHMVLAALLHDVGHWCNPEALQMEGLGARDHDRLGAEYLVAIGLQPEISALVGAHVDAKRYLAVTTLGYVAKLSPASRKTLDYQGGPMSDEALSAFKASPGFRDALRLRAWDEAAKEPQADRPNLEYYRAMLARHCREPISEAQLDHWDRFGWLHIKGWYSEDEMVSITSATDDLQARPEVAGKWMKYFEGADGDARTLCRIENFLQYEPVYAELLQGNANLNLLSLLINERAALFKEKINFKLPGGQGFSAHQDAPAFTAFGQRFHVTMMLSIDQGTTDNGCLEIATTSRLDDLLDMNEDLTLSDNAVAGFRWVHAETAPGDLVLFDSYVPHRSAANFSAVSRRALYATYNKATDGDFRARYFTEKRRVFPPDVERRAGARYDAGVFNVGNPVSLEKNR
ncbi:MAG TPA: HD domain-containing protein [Pseudomonadales bacterium]|jgi:predicted HD phosphohydrolase|nr:HD domain-containing protein [Gammaproteobacteria bacterium]HIL83402.1 HD domain-containing protein [Pseudomonadales bacterium]